VQTYSETFTSACGRTRVESSKQSVHVGTGGRPDYHGCANDVLDLVKEKDGFVEVQSLVEDLDYEEDRVMDSIDKLKRDGELYDQNGGAEVQVL
jgi:hypothetical protein